MNEHVNEQGITQAKASEHGIIHQQQGASESAVDRRRFLAHIGNAGMLGAAFLTLGSRPDAWLRRLDALAGKAGSVDRPIYMVCLGDSIMWGQGLADGQKFQTLVANWIQANNPARRRVQRWNFAHSGAGFGPNREVVIGRPTPASIGRQLNATGVDPNLAELDILEARERGRQGPTTSTLQEGSAGDKLGGEIPRTYPTVWRQLDLALETLRTGRDARGIPKSAVLPPANPEEVELVLMDGGANDVGFLDVVLDPKRTPDQVRDRVTSIIRPGIQAYLPAVLKAFPNATVVVTGYYRGLSEASIHAQVAALIEVAAKWGLANNGVFRIPQDKTASEVRAAIARMAAFDDASNAVYRDVVTQLGQGRTLFASPEFAPENAYGAPQRFVFQLTDSDPAERIRNPECDKLLGEWAYGTFVTGQTSTNDTPWHLFCLDASTFHPNIAGARRYADKIIAVLQQQRPAWLTAAVAAGGGAGTGGGGTAPAALKTMRVSVNGTTAGANKTVVVTAVDVATGQPVDGTVSIAGATGRTGAPLTYSCGEETEVVVGRRTVRRPAPACAGTVQAEGYRAMPFRY